MGNKSSRRGNDTSNTHKETAPPIEDIDTTVKNTADADVIGESIDDIDDNSEDENVDKNINSSLTADDTSKNIEENINLSTYGYIREELNQTENVNEQLIVCLR